MQLKDLKKKILRHFIDITFIVAGSIILAVGYNLFLIPHKIIPGGVSGIAMILNYFFKTPVGIVTILLNIPLFFLGIKVLGRSYGLKSILGLLLSSLTIDFFSYIVPLKAATDNPMLASIFGGILLGAGLGLVFRGGGSTGGTDILGQVWAHYSSLSTGTTLLILDFVIITAAGLCFRQFEVALLGYLNLYIHAKVVDLVLEGVSFTRAMFIVSDQSEEVAQAILTQMGRGATLVNASGAFTHHRKDMVFVVMSKREVVRARDIVKSIDDKAFVIITDVYEVLGAGFKPRTN